jgi:hypothetical protein
MANIVICDRYENPFVRYESSVIPRKDEIIHLNHRGAFRILEVAYRIADDTWSSTPSDELLMYVEIILDLDNQIRDL